MIVDAMWVHRMIIVFLFEYNFILFDTDSNWTVSCEIRVCQSCAKMSTTYLFYYGEIKATDLRSIEHV